MDRPLPKKKSVYILPNLFTTASLLSGFLGLLWASGGDYQACALAVFFSALMDGLDGKVARLTGGSSEFGIQYDSLADLAAFGVTPAFMIYHFALENFSNIGMAACFLFAVCSALRLARFNVGASASSGKSFFTGLPTPAAGCTLACLVFISPRLPDFLQNGMGGIALACTLGTAFLMVSRIRYASFKELGFLKAHPFRTMTQVIVLFALVVADPRIFVPLMLFVYIISGPAYTFITLPRLSRLENRASRNAEKQGDQPG
ncbi:MAG: CDP-diacylglycerol--serine O-phosphatidyltransferase [Desulfovibrio sp.]|jgi:CDP-diacylglycerol--serine O-phosphatidyltransferase|nr:CDP-diacylglycerol--serine O-phosphatidyltransferase [Desulfovibrio sp.]